MAAVSYCSCCGEEFEDSEIKICVDCDKETLSGPRPQNFFHICDCDGLLEKNPLS